MVKNREINGTEEIGLVTRTPDDDNNITNKYSQNDGLEIHNTNGKTTGPWSHIYYILI